MELTPQTFEKAEFVERRRGGYDIDQVETFLEETGTEFARMLVKFERAEKAAAAAGDKIALLEREVIELRGSLADANERVARAEQDARIATHEAELAAQRQADLPAVSRDDDVANVAKALVIAQDAADRALRDARAEARSIVDTANARSEIQLAEVASRVEEMLADARARADREYASKREAIQKQIAEHEDRRTELSEVISMLEVRIAGYREDLRRAAQQLVSIAEDPALMGERDQAQRGGPDGDEDATGEQTGDPNGEETGMADSTGDAEESAGEPDAADGTDNLVAGGAPGSVGTVMGDEDDDVADDAGDADVVDDAADDEVSGDEVSGDEVAASDESAVSDYSVDGDDQVDDQVDGDDQVDDQVDGDDDPEAYLDLRERDTSGVNGASVDSSDLDTEDGTGRTGSPDTDSADTGSADTDSVDSGSTAADSVDSGSADDAHAAPADEDPLTDEPADSAAPTDDGAHDDEWGPGSWSKIADSIPGDDRLPFDDPERSGRESAVTASASTSVNAAVPAARIGSGSGDDHPTEALGRVELIRDRYLEELDQAVNTELDAEDEALAAFLEGSSDPKARRFGWRR